MAVLERLDMPWPETEHDHETLKHYRGIWYWQYRYNFHEQFTCFTFFKHPSNSCGFDPQLTCIHLEAVGLQLRGELNFIIPTDELHHFFQRGRSTTNQMILVLALSLPCSFNGFPSCSMFNDVPRLSTISKVLLPKSQLYSVVDKGQISSIYLAAMGLLEYDSESWQLRD